MGTPANPEKAKLFCAVMFSPGADYKKALSCLEEKFGPIDSTYGPIAFNFTDYYEREMGAGLQKTYLTFKQFIERNQLSAIKNATNNVEKDLCGGKDRCINLDPGYIARDKLVLASTKDFYHRLYIGDGIYAEVTLHYRMGRFRYFSWSYPDYKEDGFLKFLEKARAGLVGQIRAMSA